MKLKGKLACIITALMISSFGQALVAAPKITDVSAIYVDVGISDKYHDDVQFVCEKGLMEGTGKSCFSPNKTITRASLAQIIWNSEDEPVSTIELDFEDTDTDKWYSNAVAWVVEEKLFRGDANDCFRPDDKVTKKELTEVLTNYYKTFYSKDRNEVKKLEDVISKTVKGKYPTRAEFATIVHKVYR